MKIPFVPVKERTHLDDEIHAVVAEMQRVGVNSEKYPALMTYLERLHKLQAHERREPVKLDTLVMVGGNFLVALLVVAYEQKHVITSKAVPLFMRTMRPND